MKMALYGRHLILKNKIHYTIVHLAELFHASFVNYIEQAVYCKDPFSHVCTILAAVTGLIVVDVDTALTGIARE